MPASKKRIQRGAGAGVMPSQHVPAALRDWVHIWHGVQVRPRATPTLASASSSCVFHSGSRMEALSFWQQLVRLPSNSLFSTSLRTIANPRRQYKDFLYVLLNMRWPMLSLVLLAVFLFNIVAFALLVWVACGNPNSLQGCVNLSYQTFSTIGFGIVYPSTTCSNLVMVVESFASMMVTSAITGLVFAKFAKPKAKIAFSKVCVIQPYGKKYLALVVRVANATQSKDVTHDVIMESTFKLNLLRIERNTDAETSTSGTTDDSTTTTSKTSKRHAQRPDVLCSYNLKLLQNNFITFRMGIAVVHVIDADSPLYGMSEADLAGADMILEVSMSGVDSTLQDTVSERYTYTADEFKWGYRFAELLDFNERNAEVIMDFAKLSAIDRAPIDDARYLQSPPPSGVSVSSSKRQISFRGNAKSKRPDLFPRSLSGRSVSSVEVEMNTSGSVTSAESTSLRDSDPTVLCAIDELAPDDLPETSLRRDRSRSRAADEAPRMASPRRPRRFSMGMEPLFEPLLQTSVGTQRLQHPPPSHVPTADAKPPHRGARPRLQSGPSTTDSPGLAVDDIAPSLGDYMLPEQQRQQLQNELAGDGRVNGHEDDQSTDDDDDPHISAPLAKEEDDDAIRQRKLLRSRSNVGNQSIVSIDVQDTPRFLNISPINIPKSYNFMQLYNSALYERWPKIIFAFIIAFVVINAVFACLYWIHASQMDVYTDISLAKYELAFYMSVHTLATIGYGSIAPSPTSSYMNFWVLAEAAIGIIFTTIITGIAWSKFARPRAHIHFSSKIVITNIYGHRCLVFRAANTRHSGDVHENLFRIGVILTNRKTGLRQLYDVPLVTAEWPSIKLPATLIHIIDESSPFYNFQSVDNLSESRVSVIVLLTGLDTTFSENVYARKMYFWDDFAYNVRFADFAVLQRDRVEVDFKKFDRLEDDGESYVAPTPLWEEHDEDNEFGDVEEELNDNDDETQRLHNVRNAVYAVV